MTRTTVPTIAIDLTPDDPRRAVTLASIGGHSGRRWPIATEVSSVTERQQLNAGIDYLREDVLVTRSSTSELCPRGLSRCWIIQRWSMLTNEGLLNQSCV